MFLAVFLKLGLNKLLLALLLLVFSLSTFSRTFAIPSSTPVVIDKRIRNLVHSENSIYELKFNVGYQSIIEFSLDETIETIAVGDPYPWKITPIERRLFIKPTEPSVKTNMTVITNKRVYYFEILSDYPSDDVDYDVAYVARFFYPDVPFEREKYSFQQFKDYLTEQNQKQSVETSYAKTTPSSAAANNQAPQYKGTTSVEIQNKAPNATESSIPKSSIQGNLNYEYSFEGDQFDFTPLEVFDNGKDTYFKFADNSNIPSFFETKNNLKTPITFTMTSEYVIIKGIRPVVTIEKDNRANFVVNDKLYKE